MKCWYVQLVMFFATQKSVRARVTQNAGEESVFQTPFATAWLRQYDGHMTEEMAKFAHASWDAETDNTPRNAEAAAEAEAALTKFRRRAASESKFRFILANVADTPDTQFARRQLRLIQTIGVDLNETDQKAFSKLTNDMMSLYSEGFICAYVQNGSANCSERWYLQPHLVERMAVSRDYDELTYVWDKWHEEMAVVRSLYENYVALSNEGARNGGFKDTGHYWRSLYESDTFEAELEDIWRQLLPFYEQLHAYVRRRLMQFYPGRWNTSALPAHVFGNMWAQDWANLFTILEPYRGQASIDVTEKMKKHGYTVKKIVELADEFFKSMNASAAPESFWKLSYFTQPPQRQFNCHASASDFLQDNDVRIKMCGEVTMNDLLVTHHEMGHIQYFLQYAHQPITFRDGPTPAFHEAIGDTAFLAVTTPKHLHSIGLLPAYVPNYHQDLNFLLRQALNRIAFLPFAYSLDLWRYRVFDGTYNPRNWNRGFWDLRLQYQGLVPPVPRKHTAFDPAAKFHISANTPYIRYFLSTILQFQFYRALCDVVGHTGALYLCDFSNNTAAGEKLKSMMRMGASRPWPDALEALTGQRTMSAEAMVEYFRPLYYWLMDQNSGDCFGWGVKWPTNWLANLAQPRCGKYYSLPRRKAEVHKNRDKDKNGATCTGGSNNAAASLLLYTFAHAGTVITVLVIGFHGRHR